MREVRLISSEGEQLGIVPVEVALAKAREAKLDLVEVSGEAVPPVCRILDYGKFRYGSRKRDHGPKVVLRKQHFGQIKEIRLKPKIDKNDLERKLAKGRELLEDGYRLQLTCMFKGREMSHTELGVSLLNRAVEMLAEASKLERPLLREGRRMNIMLCPKVEVVRVKTRQREEHARLLAEETERNRKKSKRRDSGRQKAVPQDGGKPLKSGIELPPELASGGPGAEPGPAVPVQADAGPEKTEVKTEGTESADAETENA